ncbi:hypothetical protein FJTKL_02108 [Diaporthe vaccinii]|uniref:Secreted protein n=1 Tax=Diaporthe vaccinii TaxID=105482 RepID=A0ABR4DYV9_9PEZI
MLLLTVMCTHGLCSLIIPPTQYMRIDRRLTRKTPPQKQKQHHAFCLPRLQPASITQHPTIQPFDINIDTHTPPPTPPVIFLLPNTTDPERNQYIPLPSSHHHLGI